MGWTRRRFLACSVGAGALGLGGYAAARDPVRLGLIGAGTQGTGLARAVALSYWRDSHGSVVAVCDVDRCHAREVRDVYCHGADYYDDYRRVLERDDVEAVLVATPDHWHARIASDALRAGKHVYCEKPISLTVREGRLLVRAVAESGRVFQGGTQQRSERRFRTACGLVRGGRLGTLHTVTLTLPQRWKKENDGPFPAMKPPAALDWDAWLGQAPLVPYTPYRCHGYFRRWYEYSGGQMTDWGAHHLDVAHWAMGVDDSGPVAVAGAARFPEAAGGFNTPIEFTADLWYANGVRLHVQTRPDFNEVGVKFEGDRGWLFVSRLKLDGPAAAEGARPSAEADALYATPTPRRGNMVVNHLVDFFRCVRSGRQPVSEVVGQHRSATACHLANIAMRLGRKLAWDPRAERFVNDPEADAMLGRPQRTGYGLPA